MIKDLGRRKRTKFARGKRVVDKVLRSPFPFFDDPGEVGEAYEIKEFKRTVTIRRPYHCGNAVYQLAKLRMLEF